LPAAEDDEEKKTAGTQGASVTRMINIRPGHIIKWFPDRGYGFIGGPDGKIAVHAAEIEKSNLDLPPKIGQPVWFRIVEGREGIRATNLSRREDAVTRDAAEKLLSQERFG
jgi:cold shock CspA family protein